MSWQRGEADSAGEILLAEEVKGFLEELSALSGFSLSLFDGGGRFLYGFSGNGRTARAGQAMGQARPAARSRKVVLPAHVPAGACSKDGSLVTQEVRLQEERVAEVRGVLHRSADPSALRRCLRIAAEWIAGRIRAQSDLDSLSGEILNKYEELALLYALGDKMGSLFDTGEICRIVLNKALSVIGARKASLLLLDPAARRLRLAAWAGSIALGGSGAPAEVLIDADKGVWGHVVKTGRALVVEDVADLPEALSPEDEPEGTELFLPVPLILSPLKVKENVLGILSLADRPGRNAYQAGELKLLSAVSAQAALAIHNSLLVRELQENERIRKEMEIAGEIQENLLPRRSPRLDGVDLAGRCVSAKRLGGDAYDFFEMPDGKLGVVVADVSGHSVGSAILMSFVRGVLRTEALRTRSPAKLLEAVNRLLYEDLCASEQFLTMSYFTYDARKSLLTYSCAGHPPAVLLKGERRAGPVLIQAEGMAIGLVPAADFEERQIRFHPGDVLALYTDGVLDARDTRGEPFGLDRFVSALGKARGRWSAEILESVFDSVRMHLGGPDPWARQQDDATVVIFQASGRRGRKRIS